jgi:hypothetical protein
MDDDDNKCALCGCDLDSPSSAGAEDNVCGECAERTGVKALHIENATGAYEEVNVRLLLDAGQALYDAMGKWTKPEQGWFTPELLAAGERWCAAVRKVEG